MGVGHGAAAGTAPARDDVDPDAARYVLIDDDHEPSPGFAEPVTASFPTRLHATRSGASRRRSIAITAAVASAITVLAASGLALYESSNQAPAQVNSSSITTSATTPPAAGGGFDGIGRGVVTAVTERPAGR